MTKISDFAKHWHVIALSKDLQRGKMMKLRLYDHPILLWRDHSGQVHALDDCCAHRRAPLSVSNYRTNEVVCGYHGWQYDCHGNLRAVPSDPEAVARLHPCSVPAYPIHESGGFIWLLPSSEPSENLARFCDPVEPYLEWPAVHLKQEFQTSEELLIDNFLDPTHTAFVHHGLIRNQRDLSEHRVAVESDPNGVKVEYAETVERVGFGMRFVFGSQMRVQHTDEFLMPNVVRVTYRIAGQVRFVALIGCTPIGDSSAGRTEALLQLRFQFGWWSALARPVIALLARRVLAQDDWITRAQYENHRRFDAGREHRMAADIVATRVAEVREHARTAAATSLHKQQSFTLRF